MIAVNELKQCPFCGGDVGIRGDFGLQRLVCMTPDCVGEDVHLPAHTPEWRRKSIAKWNRRADLSLTTDEAAFLAARLRRLFAHHGYRVPDFACDDASLIRISGAAIGAILSRERLNQELSPDAPLDVLRILIRAYVPKGTSDAGEAEKALEALCGNDAEIVAEIQEKSR